MANLMLTMVKALAKSKLGLGELNGMERFMIAQMGLPDRIPTMLAATNIEPYMLDPKYNWKTTVESVEANVALAERVCELFDCDLITVPIWQGTMGMGAADLGTVYKISEERVPYPVEYPIGSMKDLQKIEVPEEARGYLKMNFDIHQEIQRRHPDLLLTLNMDGPWDLAMLLRGDDKLPLDMRLHKDYMETDDPVRREKIKKRIFEVMELVGITAFKDENPNNLSGGEKQLVALATVLALHPSIIVFDESLSMLDELAAERIIAVMQKLKRDGTTLIIIDHTAKGLQVYDKVFVLEEGQIIRRGPKDSILQDKQFLNEHKIFL